MKEKNLPSRLINAARLWRKIESMVTEVPQQVVDRGGERARRTANCITDPDQLPVLQPRATHRRLCTLTHQHMVAVAGRRHNWLTSRSQPCVFYSYCRSQAL
jgi:hypothetical protein